MSRIGEFGLCQKSTYEDLIDVLEHPAEEVEAVINRMREEIAASAPRLSGGNCSGEIYTAMFEYFHQCLEVDFHHYMEQEAMEEIWCQKTGDLDVMAFTWEMIEELKLILNPQLMNYEALKIFMDEFYQDDSGEYGKKAAENFFGCLDQVTGENVLIYRLQEE